VREADDHLKGAAPPEHAIRPAVRLIGKLTGKPKLEGPESGKILA